MAEKSTQREERPSSAPSPDATPSPQAEETEEDFRRLYGEWRPLGPPEVATLMLGCGFRWWVAGGRALEAWGRPPRHHGDTDVAVLRRDLEALRTWLGGFNLWEAHSGSLRPLRAGDEMTSGRAQLWMRRDAYGPWLLEFVLSPSDGEDWVYKRDGRIRLPIDELGCELAGVPYFRPEVVLLFKAKHRRPKDESDFAIMRERLDEPARRWLLEALELSEPESCWIGQLS